MKIKILSFILAIVFVLTLVSCGDPSATIEATGMWRGNMAYGWGNYSYYHICVIAGSEHKCYEVEKWWDNEENPGIEIKIKNGGHIFISEGNYHMYSTKEDCLFCE